MLYYMIRFKPSLQYNLVGCCENLFPPSMRCGALDTVARNTPSLLALVSFIIWAHTCPSSSSSSSFLASVNPTVSRFEFWSFGDASLTHVESVGLNFCPVNI